MTHKIAMLLQTKNRMFDGKKWRHNFAVLQSLQVQQKNANTGVRVTSKVRPCCHQNQKGLY